jgi:hypothetical protein
MRLASIIAFCALAGLPAAAQTPPVQPAVTTVCNPAKLQGAYAFQLLGMTTIGSEPRPVASIGRVLFDGSGNVSGEVSVNFAGYFLGNPVTGKYEAGADCHIAFTLQDTSGNWQHFTGALTPDLLSAKFRQTDAGAAQDGTLQLVAKTCSAGTLALHYGFTISGGTTPMVEGEVPQRISVTGAADPDPAGALKLTVNGVAGSGTIAIDSDCIAQMTLALPAGETMVLRGVLVEGGKRILAIVTDAGTTASATFTARDH